MPTSDDHRRPYTGFHENHVEVLGAECGVVCGHHHRVTANCVQSVDSYSCSNRPINLRNFHTYVYAINSFVVVFLMYQRVAGFSNIKNWIPSQVHNTLQGTFASLNS